MGHQLGCILRSRIWQIRGKIEKKEMDKVRGMNEYNMMQEEADEQVRFYDQQSEFTLEKPLIPCHPWLASQIPIILPPTNLLILLPPSPEVPDHILSPDSELDNNIPNHISVSDSDDSPVDHIMVSDSGESSHVVFPVSDDKESAPIDVVQTNDLGSDRSEMSGIDKDLDLDLDNNDIPDHIVLHSDASGSPMVTRVAASQQQDEMGGFERNPNFTAASFLNLPDVLLE